MNCPHCGHGKTRVIATRGDLRDRRCDKCAKAFKTYECLAAYAGKHVGYIHQSPPAEEEPSTPRMKRAQRYHAVAIDSLNQQNPELMELLLKWWNDTRWKKPSNKNAAWTQNAWESTVHRVFAMQPSRAMKLARLGVETGWMTLQEKYLEGETSTDDGTVTPTNPAMRAALEAWN